MTVGLEDDSEDMDEESDGDEENSDNEISDEDKLQTKNIQMMTKLSVKMIK